MRARRGRFAALIPVLAGSLLLAPQAARSETLEGMDSYDSTHSLVGSYLAGRFARAQNDTREAADFYRSALLHDPKNELLLEQAFQTEAARGDWARAFALAEELVAVQPSHRVARLALALKSFKEGDYKLANAQFKAAGGGPVGELMTALSSAWVDTALGNVDSGLKRLDIPKHAAWAQFFFRYHAALIADVAGKKQASRLAYERLFKDDPRTLRTALAYARHAANSGDRKLALGIVKEYIEKSQGDGHPLLCSLRDKLEAGQNVGLSVRTPSEGIAEVFYGLGEASIAEGNLGAGMLYLQMALYVEPEHQFALASLANAYEANKQFAEAIATYERIPRDSPLATAVQVRKAFNLSSLDRVEEARDTLTKLLKEHESETGGPAEAVQSRTEVVSEPGVETGLAEGQVLKLASRGEQVVKLQEALKARGFDVEADGAFGDSTRKAVLAFQKDKGLKQDGLVGPDTFAAVLSGTAKASSGSASAKSAEQESQLPLTLSDRLEILDALGNVLRARKQYAEAIPYYDQAIALIGDKADRRHWIYFYARGTSYERIKNWPAAEADLKKALSLYPDQPLILNYLGYSWIDQGINLKEGMAYIEKAVSLKPDDGFIVDSLGWAHYKQGNFKEAVRYLERAVELRPDDPVLNDHLGDALWRAGREREARFQWDQALTLKPEPQDEEKIKKKLEQGLDAVEKVTAETSTPAATPEPVSR